MAPPDNQQQPPNPAPPSLSAGDHELRDYYAAQDASRPPRQNEPYLTPYLGLRARLSQTWINRWTLLLSLVLVRAIIAVASVDNHLAMARKQALSACTSVENVGSAMASMPHYMSQGVNRLTAKSIEKAINGLVQMLMLTLTGVEEIVVFVINLLTQTYLCLTTLAVNGSLHAAVSVAEEVGDYLNSTAKDVGKGLSSVASDFQSAMNGFLDGINDIGDFFTGDGTKPPTIDLSSEISKLNTLHLPSDYDKGLESLSKSIPTFAQVNNLTQTVIRFPIEEVKKLLNESLPRYTINDSIFPVPGKEQLTFCSDNNGVNDFFDDLISIKNMAKRIFLAVIITAAILVIVPIWWRELRRWKMMEERAHLVQEHARDPLDAVYIVSRPYTSSIGLWFAKKFSSARHQDAVRWVVAYATTVPALFVLSLAIAGHLSCLCQFILLRSLQKKIPALEKQIVDFSDKVLTLLSNASEQWAVGTNNIILDTNAKINDDVFGWVNTTTGAVNDTLNTFVDETMSTLNETFGGTILYDPIVEVLNCLVLLKIEGIQKGLNWVSEQAQVNVPLLPNDTFALRTDAKVSGSGVNILSTGSDGATADAISDAVDFVIQSLIKGIRQEAIISSFALLAYVVVVFTGVFRALYVLWRGVEVAPHYSSTPKFRPSRSEEEYKLRQVPPYEQATGTAQARHHSGSKYIGQSYTLTPKPLPTFEVNGSKYIGQSYTLTPKPLPTFEVNGATPPIMYTGSRLPNEKTGTVNGRKASIRR